ncbi:MAG: hypothetical protein ACOY46_16505 [Bacillota bacterium]
MQYDGCTECPVKDLQKIHSLVEKRLIGRLPEDVREPLLEARKQMFRAMRGLINHLLDEERQSVEERTVKPRPIKLD